MGDTWKLIETAPRNPFESVLGATAYERRTTHWDDIKGAWIMDQPYTAKTRTWEPTHWMPLPEPPK